MKVAKEIKSNSMWFCCFCYRFVLNAAPLTAHLQPQVQTVDVDKDAQFQCIISGHPVHEINWLHDGKPIIRDNSIDVSKGKMDPFVLNYKYVNAYWANALNGRIELNEWMGQEAL